MGLSNLRCRCDMDPLFSFGLAERVTFSVVMALALIATQYLFGFYQDEPLAVARLGRRFVARWNFSPEALGGFSYGRLAVVSLLSLFLELLTIRWISSEIGIFAYFKNFVLIACFLGFGLGCYFSSRKINLIAFLGPLAFLVLLVKLPFTPLRNLLLAIPLMMGTGSEVQIWGVPNVPTNWHTLVLLLAATGVVIPIFALIVMQFIPVGQMVGWYLEHAKRGIKGYTINVVASFAGILLYTVVCFLYQPPAVWLALAGIMLVAMLWPLPRQRWTAAVMLAACIGLAALPPVMTKFGRPREYWSPYQKLMLAPVRLGDEVVSYHLTTNGSWYQQVVNLSDSFVRSHPALVDPSNVSWNAYNAPYRFYAAPPAVLVLGSGMGNDVAAALRNGTGRVTAVEIDPFILKLGHELHFERPYQSPKVRIVLDDARSYIQNGHDRFDLIVFSLLDSHTTASHYSNIRIDNFVYTVEAFQAAQRLLAPGGLFVVKFQVNTPWIAGRLNELLTTVFGHAPLELQVGGFDQYAAGGRFYITGSEQRIASVLADPALRDFVRTHGGLPRQSAAITTDDWPYFYQRQPGLPFNVIFMSAMVVMLFFWFMRRTAGHVLSIRWHFFFLGAAFMLLEAQIISKMALLFGTTWVVNSIVIAFILLLIVLSNTVVEKWPAIPVSAAYVGIFASAAVAYAVPLGRYFFPSLVLRATIAAIVLCLPVFFAGIVFVRSFADAHFSAAALGSNLFGALVGGILESFSFWFGLKSLLVLAVVLYAASAVVMRQREGIKIAKVAA